MESLVLAFKETIKQAWLLNGESVEAEFEQALLTLSEARKQNTQASFLLCESDSKAFLVHFFAAVALRIPVFLANPKWGENEWKQAADILKVDTLTAQSGFIKAGVFHEGYIMIPTGGSAGKVKFAMHTWETLAAAVKSFQDFFEMEAIHCCCTLPLHHVSGLMQAVRSFASQGSLNLTAYEALKAKIEKPYIQQPACISLVPTQLRALINQENGVPWLKSFAHVFLGGTSIDKPLLENAQRLKIPCVLSYGMTETAAMVAACHLKDLNLQDDIAAPLMPDIEARIENEEIQLKGHSICHGYYPTFFEENVWLKTDDAGHLNEDNTLNVIGKRSRIINSGGENIDPSEVENAILETGLVDSVLVMAKPHPHWGQCAVALYVTNNQSPVEQMLKPVLKNKLTPYKIPKQWIPVKTLPIDNKGKIQSTAVARILEKFSKDA